MQEDGNFVLYNGPRETDPDHPTVAYFASDTNVNRAFVTAVLDDGNLVVCTGTPGDPEEIVWHRISLPAWEKGLVAAQSLARARNVRAARGLAGVRT